MSPSNDKPPKKRQPIDLGLEELLKKTVPADEQGSNTPKVEPDFTPPKTEVDPQDPDFAGLYRRQAWRELTTKSEQRQDSAFKQREAKLWWVRTKLAEGIVPASILTAPLDSVTQEILTLATDERVFYLSLATTILQELALTLERQGNLEPALHLSERAYELDQSKDTAKIVARIAQLIKKKILVTPVHARDKAALAEIARIDALLERLGPVASEAAASISSTKISSPISSSHDVSQSTRTSRRKFGMWMVAVVVVLLAGGALLFWMLNPKALNLNFRSSEASNIDLIEPQTKIEGRLPEVNRINGGNSLDALYYEMERTPVATLAPRIESSTAVTVATPVVPTVSPKETINLSGPVETAEIAELRRRGPEVHKEDDSGGQSSVPLFPDPKPTTNQRAARDSYAERVRGDLYEVLVRTNVLATPSYGGEIMTQLKPGDRIRVEGRIGFWVRITSQKGSVGYVLSQDVSPIR